MSKRLTSGAAGARLLARMRLAVGKRRSYRPVAPYLFIAPYFILFLAFMLYPLFFSLYVSMSQWYGIQPPAFTGLDNYAKLLRDDRFLVTIGNTSFIVVGGLFANLPLALGVALLLNSARVTVLNRFFRLSFVLPMLLSGVVLAQVFRLVFNYYYGIANVILGLVGVARVDFINEAGLVKPLITFTTTWHYVGLNALFFLAALKGVPYVLYEAAQVDGANGWQQFRYITLPQLRPIILFLAVQTVINGYQIFEEPYLMTSGGPGDASRTIVMYLQYQGFTRFQFGYAAAVGYALFAIIFVISLIQLRFFGFFKRSP